MSRALYPGIFDPVTYAHLDIIRRACAMTDELIIGVLCEPEISPLFTCEERLHMMREAVKDFDRVAVLSYRKLTIDLARELGVDFIIRDLKIGIHFEAEMKHAQTNSKMDPEIETVFLANSLELGFLASGNVKNIASYGTDVSCFVPGFVNERLKAKYQIPVYP